MTKIIGEALPSIPWQEPTDNRPVWRYNQNPIVGRNPFDNVARVFNSAVVPFGDGFTGVFRGDTNNGIPFLYLGRSKDAIHFEFDEQPIDFFKEDGTKYVFEYAYDPRLIKIDDTYYIVWCDGIGGSPTIGIGYTKDFEHFTMLEHPLLPCNRNGVLFPRKINDEYVLLSRPSDGGHTAFGDIFMSSSKDMVYWGKHKLVMKCGWEWWQGLKIGAGAAPIETDEGWLLLYHGVNRTCDGFVYSMGGAILDKDDPSKVLYRCGNYLLTPEEDYETKGFVGNVLFPCSALCDAETGRIAIYYGGADTVVGLAFTEVNRVVDYIKKYSR